MDFETFGIGNKFVKMTLIPCSLVVRGILGRNNYFVIIPQFASGELIILSQPPQLHPWRSHYFVIIPSAALRGLVQTNKLSFPMGKVCASGGLTYNDYLQPLNAHSKTCSTYYWQEAFEIKALTDRLSVITMQRNHPVVEWEVETHLVASAPRKKHTQRQDSVVILGGGGMPFYKSMNKCLQSARSKSLSNLRRKWATLSSVCPWLRLAECAKLVIELSWLDFRCKMQWPQTVLISVWLQ